MKTSIPSQMKAAAIDRFGGPEVLGMKTVSVPPVGPGEVLIQVEAAGVGRWDPAEREGEMEELKPGKSSFPYVLGTDGAGAIVAVGDGVKDRKVGDRVYGSGFLSNKGGFFAEYAVVKAGDTAPVPQGLSAEQAGVLAADGITALQGVQDTLGLREGMTVLVCGASGGVGHLAVQLARRLGARVMAVASGADGVALVKRLGAEQAVDGRGDGDLAKAVRDFAPDGFDAALVLAGGEGIDKALQAVKKGGHIAYPNGVEPVPRAPDGVKLSSYDGKSNPDVLARLNRLIEAGPFHVEVAQVYRLDDAGRALEAVSKHHLGKLALRIH
ncbi:NADP-dependent oxidoreductase [Corallococcus macrosporus]|uniref:Zinc-binding dehydrogenase family oxidoreductase n=1 Tax=Myxococcus fulvus (strain ATCC BAA-855 / HW-1) TaxID=483219 RepID=F8C7S6_MYXFH|nr:NADP-dependent oxidoreductase [Corallococcus macrosporus]AEI65677.1 zinc-binding dehydrogenase family oxidoreductase [Corallococcus macrosporus]